MEEGVEKTATSKSLYSDKTTENFFEYNNQDIFEQPCPLSSTASSQNPHILPEQSEKSDGDNNDCPIM